MISSKPSKKNQTKDQLGKQRGTNDNFDQDPNFASPIVERPPQDQRVSRRLTNKLAEVKTKNEYDEYDNYGRQDPTYSTMGQKGDFENQGVQDDYPYYSKNFEVYPQDAPEGEGEESGQNIAQRSSSNLFENKYNRDPRNDYVLYDEVDNDIRNVEEIQKELHQMELKSKNKNEDYKH